MAKYVVRVTKVYTKPIFVKADSEKDAEARAQSLCFTGRCDLGDDNFDHFECHTIAEVPS